MENLQAQFRQQGCLDRPGPQSPERCIRSPVPNEWFEQIHKLWTKPLAGLPEGVRLHAATAHALQQMTSQKPDPKNASCVIYVDGASNKNGQSWSMVVTTQGTTDRKWVETLEGVCADVVQFDQQDPKWLGATRHDNVDAELVAILVALVYALSLHLDVQVLVRPDLRFSVDLVQGMVAPSMQRPLTSLVANLGSILRAQGLFAVVRVRAHIGHAWNELADTMAVYAGKHEAVGNPNYEWMHQLAVNPQAVQWWAPLHFNLRRQALPVETQGHLQFPVVPVPHSAPLERPHYRQPQAFRLCMKIVSYNVLSLVDPQFDDQRGRRGGNKSGRIDLQFHQGGVTVAGLQEARMKEGCSNTEHYRIFSSGAQTDHSVNLFGCELWFHRSQSWVKDGNVGVGQSQFVVLVSNPRLLLMRVDNPLGVWIFGSGHAPCWGNADAQSEVQEWWTALVQALRTAPDEAKICLFLDANATLGGQSDDLIGTAGSEPPNGATPYFEHSLHQLKLACPATWDNIHVGQHGTWRHPRGQWKRIDYVVLSIDMGAWVQKSSCWLSFDGGFAHEDHIPTVTELGGWIYVEQPIRCKIDRSQCAEADKVAVFQRKLHELPVIPWQADIDEHAAWQRHHIRKLAEEIFAPVPKAKQPPWMSAPTRILISWKRALLAMCRATESPLWRDILRQELRTDEKEVRKACHLDRRAYFHQVVLDLDEAGLSGNVKEVMRKLMLLGRKRKGAAAFKALPMLRDDDGQVLGSHEEQQAAWFDRFAVVEAAQKVTDVQLQAAHLSTVGSHCEIALDDVPTLDQVKSRIRKLKSGKAPGLDQIPNEVIKAGGDVMANMLHEIFVKAVCAGREPLEWKTGTSVPLHKKGSVTNPDNYRAIFLSDTIAKLAHGCLRDRLCQTYESLASPACFGGRAGMGTDFGHHVVQSMVSWATSARLPSAHVFLDLHSAFYHVLRQSLFGHQLNDEALCSFLKRHGVSPDELLEWEQQAQMDFALVSQSPAVQQSTFDAFRQAHFTMRGLSYAGRTARGTRPGDPIGDITFNILMQLLLKEVRAQFTQLGVCDWLECSQQAGQVEQSQPAFVDVAFFDDAAFCIVARDSQQVVTLAAQVLAILSDAARKRGMNINFKPEKTEILLACSGPGSRAIKKRIHVEQGGCIPVVLEHSVEQVRCVHSYKHLGSYVQSDATPAKEVQHRIAEARKAWGPLVRNLWCNPSVSQVNKQKLFRSLIGSRFFYQCHVWSWLRDEDLRKLQHAFRDLIKPLVKSMLAGQEAHAFKTAELAAFCNMLEPAQQITVNRLRYLARAAKYQPEALWRIVQATEHEVSWKHVLAQDLQWVKSHYPSGDWPAPEANLREVCAFAAGDHQWKAKVKRAENAAIRYALRVAKHKLWTLKMHDAFQSYGLSFCHQVEKTQAAVFECQLCLKAFPTKRGLFMHSAHMHGYRPKVRYLAGGSCCLACRKEYHVRPRLMQHLRYSHECARILFEIFPPLLSDEVEALDEADRKLSTHQKALGWHVKKAHIPAMKIPSAELPPVGSPEAQAIFRKCQVEDDSSPPWYNVEGWRTAVQYAPEPVPVLETAHLFQQGHGSHSGAAGVLRRESVSVWDARVHLRTVVFVHLFSGFRRQNDLQSCIEAHTWVHSIETFCLSVDLCLQGAEGDLLDPVRVRWWRERILSRQVIGVGGGPPCETWSAARWLGSGPPPLRDRQSPWGLKHLTRKQHLQASVGTGLLEVAMELLSLVLVQGGCGFIEHPQTATWLYGTPCPSIWRLQEIREIANAEAASVASFDQCVFGAAGVKPTTLMLVRMEAFREIVMQLGLNGRCPHGPGAHVGLAGKCRGEFRTARAKIYSEALNAALAHAFQCFVFRLSPENLQEGLPVVFQQLHVACTVEDAAHVQPDYHG